MISHQVCLHIFITPLGFPSQHTKELLLLTDSLSHPHGAAAGTVPPASPTTSRGQKLQELTPAPPKAFPNCQHQAAEM